MNGRRAKQLRRAAYGDKPTNANGRKHYTLSATGQVVADRERRIYQTLKKAVRRA